MNNYADYAATQLQYYGLKPDSAEYDELNHIIHHNYNYDYSSRHVDQRDLYLQDND
jgi:hypothetical protein